MLDLLDLFDEFDADELDMMVGEEKWRSPIVSGFAAMWRVVEIGVV